MSDAFPAAPLFDAHKRFSRLRAGWAMLDDYPDTRTFIESIAEDVSDARQDFICTQAFLRSYSRKSEATYRSYRNEVERLLLWAWTINRGSVTRLTRAELEAFFDFVHKPPANWVATSVNDRFILQAGLMRQNPKWRPFAVKIAKQQRRVAAQQGRDINIKRQGHSLSHEAMKVCYSALSCFYDYLTNEGFAAGNAIPAIRKQSPYLLKGTTQSEVKRLSDLQWDYVLDSCRQAADEDPLQERTLFVIACLKVLYLRVSELSNRSNWQPAWQHLWQDEDNNYWLKVLGKGNKIRDVSVPSALLPYIDRYRQYRISTGEEFNIHAALVAKQRGQGGMTSRQLRRIVQQAFDLAYQKMCDEGFSKDAQALREATTHWLRHTGASQDIATRPLKHMADDLGHASMGTTDKVYIQSDMKERAHSGKKRRV